MPDPKPASLFSTKLVLGLAVIAIGVILTLDNLHLYDAWGLMNFWPVVFTGLGLARLVQDGPLSLRGHVWLGLSVAGLVSQFAPWGLLERWWPVLLVWGGLVVTLRAIVLPKAVPMSPLTALPTVASAMPGDPESHREERHS